MSSVDIASSFDRDGFVLVPGVFTTDEIESLESEFDRVVDQLIASHEQINARWDSADDHVGSHEAVVLHTHNVQNYSAAWLQALLNDRFLDAAEAIVGPDIVLHHSKLFQKPPGHGAAFPMHQDWRYFPTRDDSMIAAIIHVSDATTEMGCIRAFPGSHRVGRRTSTSGRTLWDDPMKFSEFAAEYPLDHATPIEAQPGDVLFFSYFTVHGSGPNVSSNPRKTVLTQLYSGTDLLDPESEHPVAGLTLRGWNHHSSRKSAAGS